MHIALFTTLGVFAACHFLAAGAHADATRILARILMGLWFTALAAWVWYVAPIWAAP